MTVPPKVREAIDKEIDRLERTSAQNPEQGWIRTWLDRVLDLPWGQSTPDNLDLTAAREVLDADHHGAERREGPDHRVPRRAQAAPRARRPRRGRRGRRRARSRHGPPASARRGGGAIVTLVGPPGVGKTSLGESVARAMGRRFVRVALGGVRDEAEIRGHRRTYVGSQPGRIARAITEAGTMNPVVLLDEVDKLSAGGWSGRSHRGAAGGARPGAEPHVPRPLPGGRPRSLGCRVPGDREHDGDHPGPAARPDGARPARRLHGGREGLHRPTTPPARASWRRAGLRPEEVALTDEALRTIVGDYTREAGVRSLERELGKLARKVATRIAGADIRTDGTASVAIEPEEVVSYLGRPRFHDEAADRVSRARRRHRAGRHRHGRRCPLHRGHVPPRASPTSRSPASWAT